MPSTLPSLSADVHVPPEMKSSEIVRSSCQCLSQCRDSPMPLASLAIGRGQRSLRLPLFLFALRHFLLQRWPCSAFLRARESGQQNIAFGFQTQIFSILCERAFLLVYFLAGYSRQQIAGQNPASGAGYDPIAGAAFAMFCRSQ